MSGYSGNASFDFEIERYKDKESGELLLLDLVPDQEDDFEYEYQVLTLKVEGRAYYSPGRTSGPPEDCYPDEGDTEIEKVTGPDGQDWQDQLTDREVDMILGQIQEAVSSYDGGYYEPDYEPDYDSY